MSRSLALATLFFFAAACSDSPSGGLDATVQPDATDPPRDAEPQDGEPQDGEPRDAGPGDRGPADQGPLPDAMEPDSGDFCPPPPGNTTVEGTGIVTWVTETGTITTPNDYTTRSMRILSPTGPDDCFAEYLGTLGSGTFNFTGIPAGPYYLDFGFANASFFVTDERTLDLGSVELGRPDTVPAMQTTTLNLMIDGANPWQDGDDAEIFSPEVQSFFFGVPFFLATPPMPGATVLSGEVPWNPNVVAGGNLIDGTRGDEIFISQLSTKMTPGGEPYQSVSKVFSLSSFVMIDGAANTITGTFADPPVTSTVSVTWRRPQFEAAAADMGPRATFSYHSLYLVALPHLEYGFYAANPDLIEMFTDEGPDLEADMVYGNPLPMGWEEFASASANYTYDIALPNTMPLAVFADVSVSARLVSGAVELVPALSPPLAPRVAGMDANTELSGVGVTPEISWTAPRIGTADSYLVRVDRLRSEMGRTRARFAVSFRTAGTSVRVPPGILEAGAPYMIKITAFADPVGEADRAPFRGGLPESASSIYTAIITP